MTKNRLTYGFTIVELLIVVVVLGILALIVISANRGVQAEAKEAKVASDLRVMEKAILTARESSGRTLYQITGQSCPRCSCPTAPGDATAYHTLPKTHACWTNYYNALGAIESASGANLADLRAGDPWGSPYLLDPNEGEVPANPCSRDHIESAGSSGNQGGGTITGHTDLRYYLTQC
ncbi:prepilin-type N-terminal cleavage/methylation domain-containing protein [Candidatus Saccharibacteria bacterium]|nr:prepilin-type N-terminal cleavage/methylation domain-containing protein [Candidatus Saccharibacteria bacterium]